MRAQHAAGGRAADHSNALHELRGAWYADHLHRDVAGRGLEVAAASRDAFMAESIMRILDAGSGDTRVVLAAHNVHIQKVAGTESAWGQLPTGQYLAGALGRDYVAIGFTSHEGRTSQIQRNPAQDEGYEILDLPTRPADDGSIEHAMPNDAETAIVDLRRARARIAHADRFRRIRMEGYFLDVPVLDAFDALACVPRTSVSGSVLGEDAPG